MLFKLSISYTLRTDGGMQTVPSPLKVLRSRLDQLIITTLQVTIIYKQYLQLNRPSTLVYGLASGLKSVGMWQYYSTSFPHIRIHFFIH